MVSQTAYVGQTLNDGRFHNSKLELQKAPFQAKLIVDGTHSVTLQGTQRVDFQQTNKFYLGGLSKLSAHVKNNLVTGKSFVGCIKVRKLAMIVLSSFLCKVGQILTPIGL